MENTVQTPQLGLQDIANLKQLVEVACVRGAFKAEEMKSVGTVYEKVDAFIKSVEAAQAQPAAAEPPAEESNG
jgi:hypothetical protein